MGPTWKIQRAPHPQFLTLWETPCVAAVASLRWGWMTRLELPTSKFHPFLSPLFPNRYLWVVSTWPTFLFQVKPSWFLPRRYFFHFFFFLLCYKHNIYNNAPLHCFPFFPAHRDCLLSSYIFILHLFYIYS